MNKDIRKGSLEKRLPELVSQRGILREEGSYSMEKSAPGPKPAVL